jgi:hypothetical protein
MSDPTSVLRAVGSPVFDPAPAVGRRGPGARRDAARAGVSLIEPRGAGRAA